jgi:hypothetical protein
MSPTELSLREARKRWAYCEVVEHWNAFTRRRHDLGELFDIVVLDKTGTIGIQCTSASNVASRVKKIADHANTLHFRSAGWRMLVWGWKKVDGKWTLREVDCS